MHVDSPYQLVNSATLKPGDIAVTPTGEGTEVVMRIQFATGGVGYLVLPGSQRAGKVLPSITNWVLKPGEGARIEFPVDPVYWSRQRAAVPVSAAIDENARYLAFVDDGDDVAVDLDSGQVCPLPAKAMLSSKWKIVYEMNGSSEPVLIA